MRWPHPPRIGDGTAGIMPVKWVDDAKSLASHLQSDAGQVADRRLRVVMASLREMLQQDGATLMWCDTSVQLADALTKWGSERRYLLEAMRSGTISLRVSSEAVKAKTAVRDGKHRRADAARQARRSEQPGS